MRFSFIPFFLLIMPVLEISVFILVGQYIGLLPTLGLILLTALLGSILLRVQGLSILQRLAAENEAGRMPGRELVHGGMIVIAGILLLTPGFVTDTLGFLLFVPAVRDAAWRFLKSRLRFTFASTSFHSQYEERDEKDHRPPTAGVIDLDEDDYHREPDPKSPWNN
ncbi:FxsA family protein [Rhizobium sp. L1K21]|uniref:FxsA family protein n=1 Tax=Rhizobium sp. L1K21 TaxID=2954933 RepID=UPI002092FE5A|nr:membrane protein FxsA [Rhizobium sp. L1K21]